MSFTADDLFNASTNEWAEYDVIISAVRRLRSTIDATARRLAKANAEWHDDPTKDDHAEHHARADKQFPREVRDEAIIDLVRHFLTEATLSQGAKKQES